jgi:hypothetical protein
MQYLTILSGFDGLGSQPQKSSRLEKLCVRNYDIWAALSIAIVSGSSEYETVFAAAVFYISHRLLSQPNYVIYLPTYMPITKRNYPKCRVAYKYKQPIGPRPFFCHRVLSVCPKRR